jgi:hypothetical protein
LRIGHKACDGDFLSHKKARSDKKEKQWTFPVHEATPLADAMCARAFQTVTATPDVSQVDVLAIGQWVNHKDASVATNTEW